METDAYVANYSVSNETLLGITTLEISLEVNEAEGICMADLGPAEWVIIFLYIVLLVIDIAGNGIVCYLILSDKQLRTITNLFLVNLAVADIAKAFTGIPFSLLINLVYRYWPFPAELCPFVAYIEIVVVFASAFTLVAMSIDRYIAIIHPLRPKLSYNGVMFTLFIVWLIAFALPIPTAVMAGLHVPVMDENATYSHSCYVNKEHCIENWPNEYQKSVYSLVIMTVQYGIPLVVLAFTYTRIAIIIWVQRTPGEAVRQRDERLASSKRKMVKMMIVVVLLYALCWLPLHTLQLYSDLDPTVYDIPYSHLLWNFIIWLALAHACCNPLIYFWMNKKFRYGFYRLLVCCFKTNVPRRQSTLQSQYSMNTFQPRTSSVLHSRYSSLCKKPNNSDPSPNVSSN